MTEKFLHTADWHLGAPRVPPLTDWLILEALYNLAEEKGVSHILAAGDIFDHHYPAQQTKDTLLEFLLEHPDMSFVFSVGNHDFVDKGQTYHSLRYLDLLSEKLPWVTVLAPGEEIVLDDVCLWCAAEWEDVVDGHQSDANALVALWHGIVPGLSVRAIEESYEGTTVEKMVKKAFKNTPNLNYIALGDIHKVCHLGLHCRYSGALVQKTFSCEDGVVLFDLDGNEEVLSLNLGKKKTYNVEFTDGEDTEQSIVAFVKENYTPKENARLVFSLPQAIYAALNKKLIRDELAGFVNTMKLENHPVEDKRTRAIARKIGKAKTLDEELLIALEEESFDLDTTKIHETCKRFA